MLPAGLASSRMVLVVVVVVVVRARAHVGRGLLRLLLHLCGGRLLRGTGGGGVGRGWRGRGAR